MTYFVYAIKSDCHFSCWKTSFVWSSFNDCSASAL